MRLRNALALAALLAAAPLAAPAASAQIGQDVVEVGGSGSFVISPDAVLVLNPVVGYFVTPSIEVGLNPQIATDFEDSSAFLTAFGAYYLPTGPEAPIQPFVGASLGASIGANDGFLLGGQAGVQRFLSESAALTLSLNVLTTDDFTDPLVSLNAGFSIFLGRAEALSLIGR